MGELVIDDDDMNHIIQLEEESLANTMEQ